MTAEISLMYHYNLSIEDCARGIIMMDELSKNGKINADSMTDAKLEYPDLSTLLK